MGSYLSDQGYKMEHWSAVAASNSAAASVFASVFSWVNSLNFI